jgi:hypothetical protein
MLRKKLNLRSNVVFHVKQPLMSIKLMIRSMFETLHIICKNITFFYSFHSIIRVQIFNLNREDGNKTKAEIAASNRIVNPDEPNRLTSTVNTTIASFYYETEGKFDVIDTDYDSYNLVYSCQNYLYFIKIEFAWIFTREKNIPSEKLKQLESKWNKGIVDNMVTMRQVCDN